MVGEPDLKLILGESRARCLGSHWESEGDGTYLWGFWDSFLILERIRRFKGFMWEIIFGVEAHADQSI